MKRYYSLWIMVVLCICLLTSIAWSVPPTDKPNNAPANNTTKYGYAMFRDAGTDQILSDDRRQYIDCKIRGEAGEDMVKINVNNKDGSLNWAEFYPGKMYAHYPDFPPSTRTVKFSNFNVAGSEVVPEYNEGEHEAVHEILGWYKDSNGIMQERNINNPGCLHVPILINMKNRVSSFQFDDAIQFAIEPDVEKPGDDVQAVTISKVDAFYDGDPLLDSSSYFCTAEPTEAEPVPYIIYQIVFGTTVGGAINGVDGFDIDPIDWDRKNKPITWRITPKSEVDMVLCVASPNWNGNWSTWTGKWIPLATYTGGLSFELVISLVPLEEYPNGNAAPAKYSSISTTWGDIKER